jgi:IS5 family transposase
MHQTKKGNQWYFVMKAYIGVDRKTGLSHSGAVTLANTHDSKALDKLLHSNVIRVWVDSAYAGEGEKIKAKAPKAQDFTNQQFTN